MNFSKKYLYLILSFCILTAFACLLFLFYFKDGGLGKGFSISIIYMWTRQFALYGAPLVILLRVIKVLSNSSFVYILTGLLNFTVGLVIIILYTNNLAERTWLQQYLWNLIIGVIMLLDTFIIFPMAELPRKEF